MKLSCGFRYLLWNSYHVILRESKCDLEREAVTVSEEVKNLRSKLEGNNSEYKLETICGLFIYIKMF